MSGFPFETVSETRSFLNENDNEKSLRTIPKVRVSNLSVGIGEDTTNGRFLLRQFEKGVSSGKKGRKIRVRRGAKSESLVSNGWPFFDCAVL